MPCVFLGQGRVAPAEGFPPPTPAQHCWFRIPQTRDLGVSAQRPSTATVSPAAIAVLCFRSALRGAESDLNLMGTQVTCKGSHSIEFPEVTAAESLIFFHTLLLFQNSYKQDSPKAFRTLSSFNYESPKITCLVFLSHSIFKTFYFEINSQDVAKLLGAPHSSPPGPPPHCRVGDFVPSLGRSHITFYHNIATKRCARCPLPPEVVSCVSTVRYQSQEMDIGRSQFPKLQI